MHLPPKGVSSLLAHGTTTVMPMSAATTYLAHGVVLMLWPQQKQIALCCRLCKIVLSTKVIFCPPNELVFHDTTDCFQYSRNLIWSSLSQRIFVELTSKGWGYLIGILCQSIHSDSVRRRQRHPPCVSLNVVDNWQHSLHQIWSLCAQKKTNDKKIELLADVCLGDMLHIHFARYKFQQQIIIFVENWNKLYSTLNIYFSCTQ